MRMSCNGCRVLRKGCPEDCSLKPCLEWIQSPESQSNATLFLAKFYGRAGLLNLINAGPAHLGAEIFRSLLYEACGRIINPVYGTLGLMCSGDWLRCHAAVEAVLQGAPLMKQVNISGDGDEDSSTAVPPLKGSDIRHLSTAPYHRVGALNRAKRSRRRSGLLFSPETETKFTITGWEGGDNQVFAEEMEIAASHETHDSFSVETVEPMLVNPDERPVQGVKPGTRTGEIGLELTLGRDPVVQAYLPTVIEISDSEQ